MMDLLDEMSIENTKDGQFYCYQIATESNVNSDSIERKSKERTKTKHVSEHRILAMWAKKRKKG